ncbi:MAG: hypothetical protein ACFFDT_34460, partial [Candidatus Hodarchaeota archaeon]
MMLYRGFPILKKITSKRIAFLFFWISVFSFTIFSELNTNLLSPHPNDNQELTESTNIPRLLGVPLLQNMSLNKWNPTIDQNLLMNNQKSIETASKKLGAFFQPSLKISGEHDVIIDNVSPEAMEINATSLVFKLNFTITGGEGQDETAFRNITISNNSHIFLITTWSDWTVFSGTDEFSLTFMLNNTVLSQLSLGLYNLTLTTEVLTHISSDAIDFPMKDLQVFDVQISPSEFNNRIETDQLFNITVQVKEDFQPVSFLSGTPSITILSSLISGISGELQFVRFLKNGSTDPYGEFKFEVKLTSSVARDSAFDDAVHTLVVSVASELGISDNGSTSFEARGTILLIKLTEISIGSNPPLDYGELTNNGSKHVEFRINVNDSAIVRFFIWDNSSQKFLREQRTIFYQDPNDPENPLAFKSLETDSNGTAIAYLTANSYTPTVAGYPVLFYVQGHKSSQDEEPSNITIFWDLLEFEFIYYDKQCSPSDYSSAKARGVDIEDWWVLNLSIHHKTDLSPAYGAQIKYRFTDGPWEYETDGTDKDKDGLLNGMFTINHTRHIETTVLFECQVVNGSTLDPEGTYFINKTYGSSAFSLNITWTYLIIQMIPGEPDQWLGTGQETNISLFATWAHDLSSFSGTLNVFDDEKGTSRNIPMTNGVGFWPGLLKTEVGKFNFSVKYMNDPL